MNYTALDTRTFFTIIEAAMAWCEITKVTDENNHDYRMIAGELMSAIESGELYARAPSETKTNWITGEQRFFKDYERATIDRNVLKTWALHRGHKPKFLFPEERIASKLVEDTIEQEETAKLVQLDKARCQAIAQVLWDMNPNRTNADIASDKYIRTYGNGSQYKERTVQNWLREVDPREISQKTGRPKKATEKAE